MIKLTLINNFGDTLGIGYCDTNENDKIRELQRQIERSGIHATLHLEETNTINMDELGGKMRGYQYMENIERLRDLNIPVLDF